MTRQRSVNASEFVTFGQLLKYLRRRAQLTQTELAIACGYSTPHISHLENNQRLPDEATLQALFVPALSLQDEPDLVERLLVLAKAARAGRSIADVTRSSRSSMSSNLPASSTTFIGRTNELAQIITLLDDPTCSLLTLVGPGGIGKTRLALQAVSARRSSYAHGIHFVSLAPVNSPDLLASAIASTLNITFYGRDGPDAQLISYLRDKQMLLLLDSFEHLLGSADLLAAILDVAAAVKIFVTSRERLNLRAETVFVVGGMDFPDSESAADARDYSAIKLFEQGATHVHPHFQLRKEDVPYAVRIARFAEGMPLAILLAAGWVEVLSVREIAEEVERSLDFLETELRDVPVRQRSMRAAFQHSWNLLAEEEQLSFSRLSVFRGGFTREAAQAVAGAGLRQLTVLFNKSLLRREPDTGRYGIHELLRQYGEKQLETSPEGAAAHLAHMNYYAEFLSLSESGLKGPRQIDVLNAIDAEFENIRTAWKLALGTGQMAVIDQMIESLYWYLQIRARFQELESLFANAAARALQLGEGLPGRTWARLQARTGSAQHARDIEQALAVVQECGDQAEVGFCLLRQSEIANDWETDYTSAIAYGNQALKVFEALGDAFNTAEAYLVLSVASISIGQMLACARANRHAMNLKREIGDPQGIARATLLLAAPAFLSGNFAQAEPAFWDSHDLLRQLGQWPHALLATMALGYIMFLRGDFAGLESRADEARKIALKMDAVAGTSARTLESLLALADEAYAQCRQLVESAAPINPIYDGAKNWIDALAAWGLQDYDTFCHYSRLFLAFVAGTPVPTFQAMSLFLGVLIHLFRDRAERAVELLARAYANPVTGSGVLDALPLAVKLRNQLKTQLGPAAYELAWERGKSLPVEGLIDELHDRLGSEQGGLPGVAR